MNNSHIQTERMTVHYRTHGDPNGLPMLLLHGSFASSRWWEPFFDILPDEIYAVAPDLRGCGLSSKDNYPEHIATPYAIEEQAEDLWAFIAAFNLAAKVDPMMGELHNFDLVGHSSGGAIAVEFALSHPEMPSTLILAAPVPLEGVFTPIDGFMLLEQMRTDRALLRQALATLMPSFIGTAQTELGEEPLPEQHFFEQIVDDATQMDPAAFTEVANALGQWNRFADARYLTLPCLVLWGDQDPIVTREEMTRTLIAMPGANNLEVLRGVGHSPMIEAPLTLAERIVDFITEDFSHLEQARNE
ncbi:MAG: alpha/beta hydrolase [Chloroflexota bacterium]